jgi:hypothetical protein
MIMPFAGGGPLKSFAVPDDVLNGRPRMCWTPDGKAITYPGGTLGLWRQRLDEAEPQPVKGFEESWLRYLAWSFDGKSLAYTSGPSTEEILLIENSK